MRIDEELLQAFPLAYAQDSEFHSRADALRDALQSPVRAGSSCPDARADARRVHDAREECHREYR
jgi:hypothetical protein